MSIIAQAVFEGANLLLLHKEVRVLRGEKYGVCLVRVHAEIYRLRRLGARSFVEANLVDA